MKTEHPASGVGAPTWLALQLGEYKQWAEPLIGGFETAARFLHSQHLYDARFLPYGSQLIPLAAILTVLGHEWEPHHARTKLAQWYWCGVLGELYGGSTETRFSRDLPEVLSWIRDEGPEPRTVYMTLSSLPVDCSRCAPDEVRRTRASTPCCCAKAHETGRPARNPRSRAISTRSIDIHHVFPQRWCKERGIEPARCDSIVNKTPLAASTNRSIGGAAPSEYLYRIAQDHVPRETLAEYLQSHLIAPELLWANDFDSYFMTRQAALLRQIAIVMGKQPSDDLEEPDEAPADYELVQADSLVAFPFDQGVTGTKRGHDVTAVRHNCESSSDVAAATQRYMQAQDPE